MVLWSCGFVLRQGFKISNLKSNNLKSFTVLWFWLCAVCRGFKISNLKSQIE